MKFENAVVWIVRSSWPLLGGAWGVWVGFGGYLGLPNNSDSFWSVFALGFYSFFAFIGLLIGLAAGALIGGLLERLLRHFGVRAISSVCTATILNALILWQLAGFVLIKSPGLRAPGAKPPVPSATKPPTGNPCEQSPPENPKERALWNSECR